MKMNISTKKLPVSQANTYTLVVVAVATVISVFCLISSKTLLAQFSHQRHIIGARSAAVKQLKTNLGAANDLSKRFAPFNQSNPNLIGGIADNSSNGPNDGDNARIVLDALPSQYDFPALATSLEKILESDQIGAPTIQGTDDLSSANNQPTATPSPTKISVTIGGISNYKSLQSLIADFERSIRPFDINSLQITGNETSMQLTIKVDTYYQQAKSLDNGTKEVK